MFTEYQANLIRKHQPALTSSQTWLALASGGPHNGSYISFAEAVEDSYEPAEWPSGEFVWQHQSQGDTGPLNAAAARADLWEQELVLA